ncbi:hypothetical protein Agub_g12628, partial [Astrephomene gubernaculifera]
MHGRPREYKNKLKSDPKLQESYKKKVDAIRNGTALVLEYRKQRKYDPAVLDASAKLLKVVPEIYTLWNFRREALLPVFQAGGQEAQRASEGELALTQACLTENPKSYSTWHHRKWVVARGLAPLERELGLVARALDEDQRNFHAWNYRQFICGRMGRSAQEELGYVEEKIVQNFSNYSAWHFRTILLHQLYCGGGGGAAGIGGGAAAAGSAHPSTTTATPAATAASTTAAGAAGVTRGSASQRTPIPHEVLDQEYDMVHQAFATDARDESPWMYYRWLVGNTLAHLGGQQAAEATNSCATETTTTATTSSSGGQNQPTAAPEAAAEDSRSSASAAAAHKAPTNAAGTDAADAAAADSSASQRPTGHEASEAAAAAAAAEANRAIVAAVLDREARRLQEEHLAAEPDARWPLLTLARLREAQARLGLAASPEAAAQLAEEARQLYGRLAVLDPLRGG